MNTGKPELPQKCVAALELGNKIDAIKLYREATGLGLKESKDAIEAHLDRDPVLKDRFSTAAKSNPGGKIFMAALAVLGAAIYLILRSR